MFYKPIDDKLTNPSVSCGMPIPAAKIFTLSENVVGYLRVFPGEGIVRVNLQVAYSRNDFDAKTINVTVNSSALVLKQIAVSALEAGKVGGMYGGELRMAPPSHISVTIPSLAGGSVNGGRSIDFELQSESHFYSCLQ